MNEIEARFRIQVLGIVPVGAAPLLRRMTERMQTADARFEQSSAENASCRSMRRPKRSLNYSSRSVFSASGCITGLSDK